MTTETQPIKLTKRMKQMLTMLDQGLTNGQIAEKIGISEHTVKVHMWRMFVRIGVENRGQASAWWRSQQPTASLPDMRVTTDHLTGCQYLMGSRGGLTPRLDADGNHICNKQGEQS